MIDCTSCVNHTWRTPEAARTSAANVPASPARLDQQLSTQALPGSRGFSPSFILLLNRHDLEQLTTRLN